MTTPFGQHESVDDLVALALIGLAACDYTEGREMPFTLRGVPGPQGPTVRPEGHSVRYTAIAALGLGRQPEHVQREVLGGASAAAMAQSCLTLATASTDAGAHALALWAAAEVAGTTDDALAARLLDAVRRPSLPTVDCAWAVVAGLAMPDSDTARNLAKEGVARLMAHQSPTGMFPHLTPASEGMRGHVGSFADQIYPVHAFVRFAAATGDSAAMAAAETTARRLVDLQGPAGQWWWHYDARTGDVVERYPTYSVHQHGMAPMVLLELAAAGGTNHREAVQRGFDWVRTHPECMEPLVAPGLGVIWRKVGRREPFKAARAAGAVATRVRPGLHVPFVDQIWPAGRVDYECRPYELGWLLYASTVMREGRTA